VRLSKDSAENNLLVSFCEQFTDSGRIMAAQKINSGLYGKKLALPLKEV
jgi:hypothetical protein